MKLTLTQFLTLDGVYRGPGSPDEDRSDGFIRGGWMVPHMDETFIALAAAWLAEADALLLETTSRPEFATYGGVRTVKSSALRRSIRER